MVSSRGSNASLGSGGCVGIVASGERRGRGGSSPGASSAVGRAVYFCDSRSPWQRGSTENTNGLLRDYFPKGVTLANQSPGHLKAVEEELNNRPRIVLQDRCPADLFTALLASPSPSVLRR